MIRLLQNELIKVFRQISWKILIALLLIAAATVPVFLKSLIPDPAAFVMDNQENYDSAVKDYEAADPSSVQGQYLKACMERAEFVLDSNIKTGGWRFSAYSDFCQNHNTEKALELIDQGKSPDEVVHSFGLSNLEYYNDTLYFTKQTDGRNSSTDTIISSNGIETYYETVPVNMKEISYYKELARSFTEKYKKLLLADKVEYSDLILSDLNKSIIKLKAEISDLEKEYKKDGGKMHEYYIAQNRLVALNAQAKALEKFKVCSPENENWIFAAIETLGGRLASNQDIASRYAPQDREYFKTLSGGYDFMISAGGNRLITFGSYEDYLSYMQNKRNDFLTAVQTLLYSVEHEIPNDRSNTTAIRYRKAVEESFTADLYLVMFLCIFLASTIMSGEYSSGSIRLLLIRPVARWKILLSKLLTVVIFCVGGLIITFGITAVSSLIAMGSEPLTVPYLTATAASATETAPMLCIVKNMLIDSTSMFLAVMLAFTISLLIKRGVVSVALGIAIFAFGQALAKLSLFVVGYVGIVRYTLIPYLMNMQNIRYEPLNQVLTHEMYFSDGAIYVGTGLIVIGIHIALLTVLSFMIFNKRQVKS